MSEPWQTWHMDRLERRDPNRVPRHKPVAARRREDDISMTLFELAREEAEQKGFNQGYADGLDRGRAEAEARLRAEQTEALRQELSAAVAPITTLATSFRQAVDNLNGHVSRALVELALAAAEHLAGRALELKPEHILDDIEDMMAENPALTGSPSLYVSVDDLNLVQAYLKDTLTKTGWQLHADTRLARGDCRIETEQREIDATQTDRWLRLMHTVGHEEH